MLYAIGQLRLFLGKSPCEPLYKNIKRYRGGYRRTCTAMLCVTETPDYIELHGPRLGREIRSRRQRTHSTHSNCDLVHTRLEGDALFDVSVWITVTCGEGTRQRSLGRSLCRSRSPAIRTVCADAELWTNSNKSGRRRRAARVLRVNTEEIVRRRQPLR
jgi:hypothetical protein